MRNLSSHLDNNCMAKSASYNYFGTVESVEGLQLPGEDLDDKLIILINFSSKLIGSYPSLAPSHVAGSYARVHGAAFI